MAEVEQDNFIKNRSVNEDFLAFLDIIIGQMTAIKLLIDFSYMSGYDLGKMEKPNTAGVTTFDKLLVVSDGIRNTYENIREKWPSEWKSWETAKTSFQFALDLMTEINKCRDVFKLAGEENDFDFDEDAMLLHIMEQIVLRTHAILFPPAIQLYRLLNWVKIGTENENNDANIEKDTSGRIIRYPYRGIAFNKDGIDEFFRDPIAALKKQYFDKSAPRSVSRAIGPVQDDILLTRIRDFLLSCKLNAYYGYRVSDAVTFDTSTENKIRELSETMTTWFSPGRAFTIALSLRRIENNVVMITPFLEPATLLPIELTIGKWNWSFDFSGGLNAFSIGPDGIDLAPNINGNLRVKIKGTTEPKKNETTTTTTTENNTPAYLIGTAEGTRLELGKSEFNLDADIGNGSKKADIKLAISKSGFYLIPGDGDSFLKKILPKDGIGIPFDLTIGYSNERGLYFEGGGGGEITIAVNKKAGGLSIPSLQLGFRKLSNSSNFMLYASLSARGALGPVAIEVEKMGMSLLLNRPAKSKTANLGILDANFDFKPPNGVGIEINAKVITGGGFLYFDREKGDYFGVAQLTIKNKISVKAVGIIQTRLPDGTPGYSFLLLISAEFPAVQLGLGFSISGVGGIVGIQRSIQLQKLKEGIYSNAIDDILFPQNPLKNAYSLVSKINNFFPAANNQYVFGIMAQLNWGPKNIVALELGLIIEFPEPVRMAIIGVLRTVISKKIGGKDYTVLNLQVNFVAAIDFDKRFISFDASLFESKLLYMKLEGDMALRVRYSDNPDFAVTIGGFHPRFQPPALDLPAKMKRLQIILHSGNPEITVTCYLAVTSNTIQFGVGGLFIFKKWGVGIRGELAFDALFQLSPFRFQTDVYLLLAASWKGYDFASIEVNGSFSGPSPWRIAGSLKLKVWIFSKTVSLDETWGDEDEAALENVNVLPLLADDVRNIANWEHTTGQTRIAVMLRKEKEKEASADTLMIHPNEILLVRQSTVPLKQTIDRFGGRRPADASKFDLRLRNKNGVVIESTKVKNHFASAQFIQLTEEQQLTAPPYELFDSGLSFEGMDNVFFDGFSAQPFSYEKEFVDEPGMVPRSKPVITESLTTFEFSLRNNAIANSVFGRTDSKVKKQKATIKENFVIVDQNTEKPIAADTFNSKAAALQTMNKLKDEKTFRKTRLVVKPAVEVVE